MNGNLVVGDLIQNAFIKAVSNKHVTYDFQKQMDGSNLLKCSEFGDGIINNT